MPRTPKQKERQQHRDESGRYTEVNRCQGCTKRLGVDYCSHALTDCHGSDGANWGDIAICLCEDCLKRTEQFTAVSQFIAYAKRCGGME